MAEGSVAGVYEHAIAVEVDGSGMSAESYVASVAAEWRAGAVLGEEHYGADEVGKDEAEVYVVYYDEEVSLSGSGVESLRSSGSSYSS